MAWSVTVATREKGTKKPIRMYVGKKREKEREKERLKSQKLLLLFREFESIQQELYRIYHSTRVCWTRINGDGINASPPLCEHGEPELADRMASERDPDILLSIWKGWHDGVGTPRGKALFWDMVRIMNQGARRNGKERSETAFT